MPFTTWKTGQRDINFRNINLMSQFHVKIDTNLAFMLFVFRITAGNKRKKVCFACEFGGFYLAKIRTIEIRFIRVSFRFYVCVVYGLWVSNQQMIRNVHLGLTLPNSKPIKLAVYSDQHQTGSDIQRIALSLRCVPEAFINFFPNNNNFVFDSNNLCCRECSLYVCISCIFICICICVNVCFYVLYVFFTFRLNILILFSF